MVGPTGIYAIYNDTNYCQRSVRQRKSGPFYHHGLKTVIENELQTELKLYVTISFCCKWLNAQAYGFSIRKTWEVILENNSL